MKRNIKLILTFLLLSLSSYGASEETTLFKVSKQILPKNVLHYLVDYNPYTCEFQSEIKAAWKMDEEEGQWKPLSESLKKAQEELTPIILRSSPTEIRFSTNAVNEFREKGIMQSKYIKVTIEKDKDIECLISAEVKVDNTKIDLIQLHSVINVFSQTITSARIIGYKMNGTIFDKTFK